MEHAWTEQRLRSDQGINNKWKRKSGLSIAAAGRAEKPERGEDRRGGVDASYKFGVG